MINLEIDTSELSAEFDLSRQEVDQLLQYTVDEVSTAFARQWKLEAKQSLNQTREEYVNAIQITKQANFTNIVYLNPAAKLANMIEMGASEFDMKDGLLSSKKVKYTEKGNPYITVPFRFGVPTTIGDSSAFSGIMPTVIHNKVKRQTPTQQLSLGDIPKKHQIPHNIGLRRQVKSGNFKNITEDTRMTSIYEGMKKTEGGYVTFRRVSLNSDADRFVHPGFVAKNLAQQALGKLDIPQVVDVSLDSYLNQLGF